MNNSNIVAIPSHPPLPRGVPGVFQSAEQPYYYARESKAPIHLQQIQPAERRPEPPRPATQMPGNAVNRVRSNSSYHPYQTNAYRRDSATSLGSNDGGYRPVFGSPSHSRSMDLPMQIFHRSRQASEISDNSTSSTGDKGSSERKYVCDWKTCGQSFDRIEHLNRHKRRHTGEKPYCCLVSRCSKKFSRFDNMMQHVGIHTLEGHKTEIPNIKNLNAKCNGRGRARRTSYRGTQDPHEKFRRHVEGTLGSRLAKFCILPAGTPDFSNLTLRPLLVECDENSLSEAAEDQPLSERVQMDSKPAQMQRPRSDSVMGSMEKNLPILAPAGTAAPNNVSQPRNAPAAPLKSPSIGSKMQSYISKFRVVPAANQNMRAPGFMGQSFTHNRSSFPQSVPTDVPHPDARSHRHSMSGYPQHSSYAPNVRNQPGYPSEYANA
ncbi:hypothetical protein IWW50_000880 [Coemansia erecta]|nr:hypothetical protein GGF43_001952 [Coemansia sp. RSA 2618]KAJ2829390.1 hypothetical protein IWW50_000880 [Coemansia erecta]